MCLLLFMQGQLFKHTRKHAPPPSPRAERRARAWAGASPKEKDAWRRRVQWAMRTVEVRTEMERIAKRGWRTITASERAALCARISAAALARFGV